VLHLRQEPAAIKHENVPTDIEVARVIGRLLTKVDGRLKKVDGQ
jgi:hypothetical protein